MTLPATPLTEQERRALTLAAQGYTDISRIHAVAIAATLHLIAVPLPGGSR